MIGIQAEDINSIVVWYSHQGDDLAALDLVLRKSNGRNFSVTNILPPENQTDVLRERGYIGAKFVSQSAPELEVCK